MRQEGIWQGSQCKRHLTFDLTCNQKSAFWRIFGCFPANFLVDLRCGLSNSINRILKGEKK